MSPQSAPNMNRKQRRRIVLIEGAVYQKSRNLGAWVALQRVDEAIADLRAAINERIDLLDPWDDYNERVNLAIQAARLVRVPWKKVHMKECTGLVSTFKQLFFAVSRDVGHV